MNTYNLASDEFILLQEDNVKLGTTGSSERLTEVVLTNKHIILVNDVTRGLFKTERLLKRCPLSNLQRYEGEAQTPILKQKDHYCLQLAFADEAISILFTDGSRRTVERWSRAIQNAANGNFNDIDHGDVLPPDLAEFIDGTKDVLGSLVGKKKTAAPKSKASPVKPKVATVRCPGCHAPLTGNVGSIATCAYCDTKHAL